MKRSLVLGCAAVALAAGCGSASAQSKFDVLVGGDAFFQGAYVDQDVDAGQRTTEFSNRMRVTITPTAKADNGLEYGARLRIRAVGGGPTRTTDNDRAFIFANGSFGSIQAGTTNGLSDDSGIIGPNPDGIEGSPDGFVTSFYTFPGLAGGAGALPYVMGSLRTLESGDVSSKLVYQTPSFAGFKLGAAYTPVMGSSNTNVNRTKGTTNYRDVGEVQGSYTGAFGAVAIEASAAYQFGKADVSGTEDLSSVHAGLNIGFGGFKIGGSYAFSGESGYAKGATGIDDAQVWIVGANYTTGPIILALNYTDAQGIDGNYAGVNARTHLWQAGVTYTIAPGFTTGLEYSYFDNRVGTVDNDANVFLLDTRFAF